MIKHWIVSDHYNPAIKSEVIWDMLLSDFVCDMMRAYCKTKEEIILLAKEFPYINSDKNISKVDYLVGVGKELYFVELKTNSDSFNESQYKDYMNYVNENPDEDYTLDRLWERYKKSIPKKKSAGNYYKNSKSQKYAYQIERMKRVCNKANLDNYKFIEYMKDEYQGIKVIYITFDKIEYEKPVDQIVIENHITEGDEKDNFRILEFKNKDDEERRERWRMVLDIIRDAMKGSMPKPI